MKKSIIIEYVCPQCGKRFVMPFGTDLKRYTYKIMTSRQRVQYMCSYHCFRVAEKREEKRRAKQKAATKIKREACEDDAKI